MCIGLSWGPCWYSESDSEDLGWAPRVHISNKLQVTLIQLMDRPHFWAARGEVLLPLLTLVLCLTHPSHHLPDSFPETPPYWPPRLGRGPCTCMSPHCSCCAKLSVPFSSWGHVPDSPLESQHLGQRLSWYEPNYLWLDKWMCEWMNG